MASQVFNLEQLSFLNQCRRRSETLVECFYSIPALPSKQYPYEVVTLVDLEEPEKASHAFAHLVVYERHRQKSIEHLYRICLQDDVILSRLAGHGLELLSALLVYILSHEIIHVVRFQRAEQSFLAGHGLRQKEEDLVHQITLKLLGEAREPFWEQLDALYGNPVIPARMVQKSSIARI